MDSITQITLGAAVGEVALGKKVGNRAMLWGAIGGTIPDLDVLANINASDISALAFHRAFTHSLTFAFIAPIVLGWIVHRLYEHKGPFFSKDIWLDFGKVLLAIWGMIMLGTAFMPVLPHEIVLIGIAVSIGIMTFPVLIFLREKLRQKPATKENADWKGWAILFFWAIFTHPLLDSCTTYGTQLFQPFSDYRVSFNNISVADPIYTIPFLLCLIIASFLKRGSKTRAIFNWLGIALSSAYMILTVFNKMAVNQVFETSLKAQGIQYERMMTTPTILNNVLWSGVAEGDTAFYHSLYSLLDKSPEIPKFNVIPKNHHLIEKYKDDRVIKILKWFADDYYSVLIKKDGRLQLNDLRYGAFGDSFEKESDYIFNFILEETPNGLSIKSSAGPPEDQDAAAGFSELWERIKGI